MAVVEMDVTKFPCELLNEIGGFKMVEVHLPIAGDQWNSLRCHVFACLRSYFIQCSYAVVSG